MGFKFWVSGFRFEVSGLTVEGMQSLIPKAPIAIGVGNEGMAALALKEPNQGFHPFPLVRDLNPSSTGFKLRLASFTRHVSGFRFQVSSCTLLPSLCIQHIVSIFDGAKLSIVRRTWKR